MTELILKPRDAGPSDNLEVWRTELVPVDETAEIDMAGARVGHHFVGVRLFDVDGDPVDAGSAGTFTVEVKTWNTGRWEPIEDYGVSGATSFDATDLATGSFEGHPEALRVVPGTGGDAVAGAVSYQVSVSSFKN